jgi:hypothetical protein
MAGFNFNPITVQPQQQTSLGDMLNIARNAQAYQQSQQLNPLQLQQQQELTTQSKLATQEAEQTLESKISSKKSEAQRFLIEAEKAGIDAKAHYANLARSNYAGLLTDPDFINGNKEKMVEKLNKTRDHLEDLGIPMHDSRMHESLVKLTKNDPQEAYQQIVNGVNIASGAQNQFNQVSGAQNIPIYKGPTQTSETPSELNVAPQAKTPIVGIQPKQMTLPSDSQPIAPTYPVRVPGQPSPAPLPQEIADTNAGSSYRNQLVNRQSNLTTERRNIDEVVKTAKELQESVLPTSGVLGGISRKISTWAGDPTYIELSKNLAKSAISNMQALGLSTDADKQLVSAAQGDYTYPPEVLMKIANRTKADMTNIDMQATAVQNYAKRFGDSNMKSFQQMWSKNADSKVFELMNLASDPSLTKEEKQVKTNELLGLNTKMTDKEKKEIIESFRRKKINLLKMTETGTL